MPTVHSNDIRYYTQEYRDGLITALETIKQETEVDLTSGINGVSVPNNNVSIEECKQECLDSANLAKTHIDSIEDPINTVISKVSDFYDNVQSTGDEINTLTANANEVMEAFITSLYNISDELDSACRTNSTLIDKERIDDSFAPMEIADSNNKEFLTDYFTDDDGNVDRGTVEGVFNKLKSDPEANEAYADAYADFCVDYISDDNTSEEQIEGLLNLNLQLGMEQTYEINISPTAMYIDDVYYAEVFYVYEPSPSLLMINERMYDICMHIYNEQYSDWSQYEGSASGLTKVTAYLDTMGVLTSGQIAVPYLFSQEDMVGLDPDINIDYQYPRPFPHVEDNIDDSGTVQVSFGVEAEDPAQQVHLYGGDGSVRMFESFQVEPLMFDLATQFSDYDVELLTDYEPELISYETGSLVAGTGLNIVSILESIPKIKMLIEKTGKLFPFLGYILNALDIFFYVDSCINAYSILNDYQAGKQNYNYILFLDRYYDVHAGVITFNTYDGESKKVVSAYSYTTDQQTALTTSYWVFIFDYYGIDSDDLGSMTDQDLVALLQEGGNADENSYEQFESKMRSAFENYCERTGLSGISFDSLSYEQYSVLAGCIGNEDQMDELVSDYEENGVCCFL